jgi:hypothetical protein
MLLVLPSVARKIAAAGRKAGLVPPAASLLLAFLGGEPAAAGAFDHSFLFATPEACAASGAFRRRQCDNAFANARTELQERTKAFTSRERCQARFHLCERAAGAAQTYRPALLGVEIVMARNHATATPVLAVATPRLFAGRPISRLIEPARPAPWVAILPADHFRLDHLQIESRAEPPGDDELRAGSTEAAVRAVRESDSARRERLRAAPFVE